MEQMRHDITWNRIKDGVGDGVVLPGVAGGASHIPARQKHEYYHTGENKHGDITNAAAVVNNRICFTSPTNWCLMTVLPRAAGDAPHARLNHFFSYSPEHIGTILKHDGSTPGYDGLTLKGQVKDQANVPGGRTILLNGLMFS